MFDDLNKTLKESAERWKKIEELATELEYSLSNNEMNNKAAYELLVLLVDHMRPMNPSLDQINEATQDLTNLLNTLKK